MSYPIVIQAGSTINACFVGLETLPVRPPILGPCNILTQDDRIRVYDCDGNLVTVYMVCSDGSVLEPVELSGNLLSLFDEQLLGLQSKRALTVHVTA